MITSTATEHCDHLMNLSEPIATSITSSTSNALWYDDMKNSPSPPLLSLSAIRTDNDTDTVESFIDVPNPSPLSPSLPVRACAVVIEEEEDARDQPSAPAAALQVSTPGGDGALHPESVSSGVSPSSPPILTRMSVKRDFRRSRSPSPSYRQHHRKRTRDRSPSPSREIDTAGKRPSFRNNDQCHHGRSSSSVCSSSSPPFSSSPASNERDRKQHPPRSAKFSDLPLEWWERGEDCKEAKIAHVDKIDYHCKSREFLVLQTTLWRRETALELNMFPYDTPKSIRHYTLWSRKDLSHDEIVEFVDGWLDKHHPQVRRWQYDDNYGDRSILLFHVHVFVEMDPFSFSPRPGLEYFPPHMNIENDPTQR